MFPRPHIRVKGQSISRSRLEVPMDINVKQYNEICFMWPHKIN